MDAIINAAPISILKDAAQAAGGLSRLLAKGRILSGNFRHAMNGLQFLVDCLEKELPKVEQAISSKDWVAEEKVQEELADIAAILSIGAYLLASAQDKWSKSERTIFFFVPSVRRSRPLILRLASIAERMQQIVSKSAPYPDKEMSEDNAVLTDLMRSEAQWIDGGEYFGEKLKRLNSK